VRSGTVTVANALGSGLVESAAPASFLPGLCRRILGEELKMPAVATWWCGEEPALSYVVQHLSKLVIKPAFPSPGKQPVFGSRLSEAEAAAWVDRIQASPSSYVAQEQVALSTVPVWEDGELRPRHLVLRVYAVACGGTYTVMPGGLARVTTSLDSLVASMQSGGGSKDAWVSGAGPAAQFSLLPHPTARMDVNRATFDLPSRAADNLFWLGRYAERVEPAVRVARAILPRLFQELDLTAMAGVAVGRRILTGMGYIRREAKPSNHGAGGLEEEVLALIYNGEARNGLPANIRRIRRVGWLLRDRISADAWRVINQLDLQLSASPPPEPVRIGSAQALLDRAIATLAAFGGMVMESVTRGDGWRFLDMGRRIERAAQMVDLIRYGLAAECDGESGQLDALLEIADCSLTYRSRYFTSMQPDLALDLLLLDEANPRSVAYQLARLREHIERLPGSQGPDRRPPEARIAISLLTAVQLADAGELMNSNLERSHTGLHDLLNRIAADLRSLSEALTREYFNQAAASKRFSVS
jgi:uncharacterized alpha-E superfamily protein